MSAAASSDDVSSELDECAAVAEQRIVAVLAGDTRRSNAELRKVLQRIASEIQLLRRLLNRNPRPLPPNFADSLRSVLDEASSDNLTLDHAWYVADSLRLALLDVGDDAYIATFLEHELSAAVATSG